MVLSLVSCGIYTRSILFFIIFSELIAILILEFKHIVFFLQKPILPTIREIFIRCAVFVRNLFDLDQLYPVGNGSLLFNKFVVISSLLCIASIFIVFISNLSSFSAFIFTDDTTWNGWTIEWFKGSFPSHTYHYAQLIPANFSIAYVLMGAPIQYFPKIIAPLFMLYLSLIFFDLGCVKKTLAYFVATITLVFLVKHLSLEYMMTSSYADIPVAFMGFLAISCLLVAQDLLTQCEIKKYLLLGALFALAAGVTKQAGLYIVLIYPLLSVLFLKNKIDVTLQKKIWWGLSYIMGIFIIVLPMYFYAEVQIRSGNNRSEVSLCINDAHREKNKGKRFLCAIKTIIEAGPVNIQVPRPGIFNWAIFFVMFFLTLLILYYALQTLSCAYLFIFVWAPFFVIWGLFFSYDARNYTLSIPFYALAIGTGIQNILKLKSGRLSGVIRKLFMSIEKLTFFTGAIVALLGLFMLNYMYTPEYLIEKNALKSMERGKSTAADKIYRALFDYLKNNNESRPILVDLSIKSLVAFDKYNLRSFSFSEGKSLHDFITIVQNGDVEFIYVPYFAHESIVRYVDTLVQEGRLKILFEADGYRFIRINQ